MTNLEDLIEQARNQLVALRENATKRWFMTRHEADQETTSGELSVIITDAFRGEDAALVATLIRTVEAQIDVLNSGLEWFSNYEEWYFESGRKQSPDRDFTIRPEGRAIRDLALAILDKEYR